MLPVSAQRLQGRNTQEQHCKRGNHLMLATFTPGERRCQYCAFITYCTGCRPNYLQEHPGLQRAWPLECLRHQKAEAQR